MGAKLSRRKSESAAGAEEVAAETPATDQPETADTSSPTENNEQKLDEAEDAAEPQPTEVNLEEDTAPGKCTSDSDPPKTITQAVEEIVSTVTEQIANPVEDIVNKGMGAVETMMAAVSVKDDPTKAVAVVPDTEPKSGSLVDLLGEAKIDFTIPEPPEEPAHIPPKPSSLEDLLLSQPLTESLLPEPVSAAIAKDIVTVAVEDEGVPGLIDIQIPHESEEPLMCMKEDTAPAEDPLDYEVSANPTLNSDLLVGLGDIEQAVSTAVHTVNDLI